eukprot:scaffold103989_cov23-Cyclotella_meneghiniana.AAC.1
MNSEPRIDGLMVGETQRTILARNFASIRDGDPNFYKNSITDPELLDMIENTTFADVIRRNSDHLGSLDDVRDSVFFSDGNHNDFSLDSTNHNGFYSEGNYNQKQKESVYQDRLFH